MTSATLAPERTKHQAPAKFLEIAQRKHEDHLAMLELATETLGGEPLTVAELAHVLGVTVGTSGNYVDRLIAEGKVFTRSETQRERTARFGVRTRGSLARLYSTHDPVPRRTISEATLGIDRVSRHNPPAGEVKNRILSVIDGVPRFGADIAEIADVPAELAHTTLSSLARSGKLSRRKVKRGKTKVYAYWKTTPAQSTARTAYTTLATEPSTLERMLDSEIERRVELQLTTVGSENESLKARVRQLESELETIRAAIRGAISQ